MSFDADAAACDEGFWKSFSRQYKTKLLKAGWKGPLNSDGLEDPANHDVLSNVLYDAVHRDGKEVRFDEAHAEQDIPGGGGSDFASIKKLSWSCDNVWLIKLQTSSFCGLPENMWNSHICGYQFCVKSFKGRTLGKEGIAVYHKIVVALSEPSTSWKRSAQAGHKN
jgi:hypothetical protein